MQLYNARQIEVKNIWCVPRTIYLLLFHAIHFYIKNCLSDWNLLSTTQFLLGLQLDTQH